jgi:hypothetical protein
VTLPRTRFRTNLSVRDKPSTWMPLLVSHWTVLGRPAPQPDLGRLRVRRDFPTHLAELLARQRNRASLQRRTRRPPSRQRCRTRNSVGTSKRFWLGNATKISGPWKEAAEIGTLEAANPGTNRTKAARQREHHQAAPMCSRKYLLLRSTSQSRHRSTTLNCCCRYFAVTHLMVAQAPADS